jgi:signal transduction histidine kinase/FixJ family two-component response regulator
VDAVKPTVLEGLVVEEGAPSPSPHWQRLELSSGELDALLKREEPFLTELPAAGGPTLLGPLAGMRRALWLPLRLAEPSMGKAHSIAHGLALLAYSGSRRPSGIEAAQEVATQLAVAIGLYRSKELLDTQLRMRAACLEIERALLRGDTGAAILNEIAEQTARHTASCFIGILAPPSAERQIESPALAFAGPSELMMLVQQDGVRAACRKASVERQAVVETLDPAAHRRVWTEPFQTEPVGVLAALPLESEGALLGLLVAGFSPGRPPQVALEVLEPFAVVAAGALREQQRRAQLEEAAATCRSFLDVTAEYILLVDVQGRIQDASQQARKRLGLDLSASRPVPLESLFSPEAQASLQNWLAWCAEAGSSVELVLRSGETVRLSEVSASRGAEDSALGSGEGRAGGLPRPTRGLCWLRLEERTSSLAVEPGDRLQSELRDLLDSLDCGVLVFGLDPGAAGPRGYLRAANARFAQMMGLEGHRLSELTDFDALVAAVTDRFRDPQKLARRWREVVQAALADEASCEELELVRPTRKVVERYTRPVLDPEGRPLGWLEVYRDITSQRLIQSKLLQTEKMAALGQLVSGIAHELNNPLTSIMGYAQLLLGRRGRADRLADIKHIFEEADRAGRIVKNLLLFAREAKPERKPVDLNEVVERTLTLRSYELKVENIAVELQLTPDLPRTLADAHQLQQVVLNLVVNAEQAILHARGQGHIRVRTRVIPGRRLALEVADDGPGIPPEIASRIFDPFFTTKPVGVGTGLGLSIVYGIVQEHGGEIYVESAPGQGATFVVELPVAAELAEEAEPEPSLPKEEVAAPALASGHRILVVEDEPTVAQLIMDVLGEEGHRVDAVLDSQEGLDRVARYPYDLVICDLRMPWIDGRTFHQALVRTGNPAQHHIVFITGDTLAPRTLEFLERNHLPFLAKPFLVEELKLIVNRTLEAAVPEKRSEPRTSAARRPTLPRQERTLFGTADRQEVIRKQ